MFHDYIIFKVENHNSNKINIIMCPVFKAQRRNISFRVPDGPTWVNDVIDFVIRHKERI